MGANLYPLEYAAFFALTALVLSRLAVERGGLALGFWAQALRVFLPILLGIVALSVLGNLLTREDGALDFAFQTIFLTQLILHFCFVAGSWLLRFGLRRFLWHAPVGTLSGRTALLGLGLVLLSAVLHALCASASLTAWMNGGADDLIAALYGAQQGVSYLTFVLAWALEG